MSYKKRVSVEHIIGIILVFAVLFVIGCTKFEEQQFREKYENEIRAEIKQVIKDALAESEQNANFSTIEHIVFKVIDGDTFEIETGEKVRFIGIDTPERNEPYYEEAKLFLTSKIQGRKVTLQKDVSDKDQFGRLLRYVYSGGELINLELVESGYAKAVSYPPDTRFNEIFNQAESYAKSKGAGIWYDPKTTQKQEFGSCSTYNNDNVHKIKYDFWDIETNNKINQCLETSENIEFIDVTNNPFVQKYPSVDGNFVAWEDYRNGKSDVYLYDIAQKETKRITTYENADFKPIVRKDLILYHKLYEGNAVKKMPQTATEGPNELFLYDIKNDTFIQLSNVNEDHGIITKEKFDGDYFVSYGLYKINKINRDPDRIVTVKHFGDGGNSFFIDKNGEIESLSLSKDNPIANTQIKFVPGYIQKLRKSNIEPPVGFGGVLIINDPTPPNFKLICTSKWCDRLLNDPTYMDCWYSEKFCKRDTSHTPSIINASMIDAIGDIPKDGYLIGGKTILKIDGGEYYQMPEGLSYKQINPSIGVALEYDLKWGLENLAMVDPNKKPAFYSIEIPKEALRQFDSDINGFKICLKMHKEIYNTSVCDRHRNYLRIYDFKKDKFYTIRGSLWEGNQLIEMGSLGEYEPKVSIGEYEPRISMNVLENDGEFEFNDNKIVWTVNNEKIINGVSDQNTEIRLAVIE